LKNESYMVSQVEDDEEGRENVKYAYVSWEPEATDIGFHLVCITAYDDIGYV